MIMVGCQDLLLAFCRHCRTPCPNFFSIQALSGWVTPYLVVSDSSLQHRGTRLGSIGDQQTDRPTAQGHEAGSASPQSALKSPAGVLNPCCRQPGVQAGPQTGPALPPSPRRTQPTSHTMPARPLPQHDSSGTHRANSPSPKAVAPLCAAGQGAPSISNCATSLASQPMAHTVAASPTCAAPPCAPARPGPARSVPALPPAPPAGPLIVLAKRARGARVMQRNRFSPLFQL